MGHPYHKLLDGFGAVFGREAIVVRRYHGQASGARLMESFVQVLLPAGPDPRTFDVPQKRYNGSLKFSQMLRIFGSDLTIAPHLRFAPLTLAHLGMLGARFAPSNAMLALRYGLLLPTFERGDLKLAAPFTSRFSEAHAAGRARDELRAARPVYRSGSGLGRR